MGIFQSIIFRIYKSVFSRLNARVCIYLVRTNLWLMGVTFGKRLIAEGNVYVGDGSKVLIKDYVRLGKDVYLGTFPSGFLSIGSNTYIGRYSIILAYDNVQIGKDCLIAPYCHITDTSHNFDDVNQPIRLQKLKAEKVIIEDDVWLGAGVSVLPGVTIGRGSVIGARAVVSKDIPAYSIAVGVPAKVLKKRSNNPKEHEN